MSDIFHKYGTNISKKENIFFTFLFLIFLERESDIERGREKHQCVVVSHVPPTGDLAHNPGMCPDWELNQRCFSMKSLKIRIAKVIQWQTAKQRVTSLIPSQGTCLGCGPGPWQGTLERQPHIDVSLLLFLLSCLSIINKIFKKYV